MKLITPSKAQTFCRRQSRSTARKRTAAKRTPTAVQPQRHVLRSVVWRAFKEVVIFIGLLLMHLAREAYSFASTYRLPPSDEDYETTTPYSSVNGKKIMGRSVSMDDLADAEESF